MVHVMHTVSINVKKVSFKIPYLKFHEASQPLYLVYMDSGLTHHVQGPHFPQDTFDTHSSTQTVLCIKNMLFTVTLYWSTAQKINPKQLKKHSWSTTFMEKICDADKYFKKWPSENQGLGLEKCRIRCALVPPDRVDHRKSIPI